MVDHSIFIGLGHVLKLFHRFEFQSQNPGREQETEDYVNVGGPSSSQTAKPQISQNDLSARMGQNWTIFTCHGQTDASLTAPIGQFISQQVLCQVVILYKTNF